jgi:hypothetical protein
VFMFPKVTFGESNSSDLICVSRCGHVGYDAWVVMNASKGSYFLLILQTAVVHTPQNAGNNLSTRLRGIITEKKKLTFTVVKT